MLRTRPKRLRMPSANSLRPRGRSENVRRDRATMDRMRSPRALPRTVSSLALVATAVIAVSACTAAPQPEEQASPLGADGQPRASVDSATGLLPPPVAGIGVVTPPRNVDDEADARPAPEPPIAVPAVPTAPPAHAPSGGPGDGRPAAVGPVGSDGSGDGESGDDSPTPPPSDPRPVPARELPPVGDPDIQLGEVSAPASGVEIVVRDHGSEPAPGVYSICAITLPTAGSGASAAPAGAAVSVDTVFDGGVAGLIRGCADRGFDAVTFGGLDQPVGTTTVADRARAVATEAHRAGLAVGQTNAPASSAVLAFEAGFEFSVAEGCVAAQQCHVYTAAYGASVIGVEYVDSLPAPWSEVCADPATPESVVLRDRGLAAPGDPGYVLEHC